MGSRVEQFGEGMRRFLKIGGKRQSLQYTSPMEVSQHASRMDAIIATVGQKREQKYRQLLETIEHSKDPIGAGLNALFDPNCVVSRDIEKRQLTAGVTMNFSDMSEEGRETIPQEIRKFLGEIYKERPVQLDEIIVFRESKSTMDAPKFETFEPFINIRVSPLQGTGSEAERKRKWILSRQDESAIAGYITLNLEHGQWRWTVVKEPIGAWMSEEPKISGSTFLEGDVDEKVLKAIAKLIPVPPINLKDVCRPGRKIFITPDVDPSYGHPLTFPKR